MEVKRIFDLLENYQKNYPHKHDVVACKTKNGWKRYSVDDYVEEANAFSYGLLSMHFEKGQKIATVSNNRPEWNFADMGMAQLGVIHVPIYPTISEEDYLHILTHSEARIMIISSAELYKKIAPLKEKIPNLEEIYTFDKIEGVPHWSEISEKGRAAEDVILRGKLKLRKDEISEHDMASIIYTSGTTGLPKGVMLSHWNFIYQAHKLKILESFLMPSHRALSFLPLCHVLERMGSYFYQFLGVSIYYAESIDKISDNLKEVKPHIMITVPRLLERIYDKIISMGKDLDGVKRNLFFWAVNLGLEYETSGKGLFYKTQLALANKLIFSKWREALGGNILTIISGGAALQPRLARTFWAAQIPIQEGYGLTETAPVIAANHCDKKGLKFGTVGPLLDPENQQVKIADDGEILFKGPNLMQGYYKNPERTSETIDKDGWFHTGDIGKIEDGRFLKITDRKKEMFKLSTGKYVAPQVVENVFKESLFIEQLMVVGANEKYTAALISPNFEYLHDWCAIHDVHFRDNQELVENAQVVARYQQEVDKYNERLGKTEKIKRFKLVCEEWTPDNGELSPTLKLKRRFVREKYKTKFNALYEK